MTDTTATILNGLLITLPPISFVCLVRLGFSLRGGPTTVPKLNQQSYGDDLPRTVSRSRQAPVACGDLTSHAGRRSKLLALLIKEENSFQ